MTKAEKEAAAKAKTEEEEAAKAAAAKTEKVSVKAIQDYHDLQLKRIVEAGEQLEVDSERAAMLIELKLVAAE